MSKEINTGQTWEHRLALRVPRPLFFSAVLIAAFLCAAYLSFQWSFGFEVERSGFGMVVFLVAVLLAPAYFFRVDGHLDETAFRKLFLARIVIRTSRFTGIAGVLVFVGLWALVQVSKGREFLSLWNFYTGSSIAAMFLWLGWLFGRMGYFWSAGIWNRPGPQRSDIDLLNLEGIYTIGRSGLKSALIWFIVIAIAGLLILPDTGTGFWVVLILFVISIGVGLMFLLAPAKNIRSLIREVKREELARLAPLLRQARDDTLTHDTHSPPGHLSDLLAYKNQVESTHEWPFDSTTLFRFCLYLLIPVGSMVGGALVERVVDLALD